MFYLEDDTHAALKAPMDTRRRRQEEENIRLDGEGNWFQSDYPILHERTIQFLYKNIELDEEGRYYLTGEDKPIYFKVEEVPYWVTKIERTIAGYLITLTDGSIELLSLDHLWVNPKKNTLYCAVKGGRIPAKFFRAAYYDLATDLEKDASGFHLNFRSKQYRIMTSSPKSVLIPGQRIKPKPASSADKAAKEKKPKPSRTKVAVRIKQKKKQKPSNKKQVKKAAKTLSKVGKKSAKKKPHKK